MGINYQIRYSEKVGRKQVPALSSSAKEAIRRAIEERLMVDPIAFGKPLRYSLKGHRRLRVGDYRIVYRIALNQKLVIIVAIKHRKDIYEE